MRSGVRDRRSPEAPAASGGEVTTYNQQTHKPQKGNNMILSDQKILTRSSETQMKYLRENKLSISPADCYFLDRYADVESLCRSTRDPNMVIFALCLHELDETEKAIKILRDFADSLPLARLELARILADQGKIEEALAMMKADTRHPDELAMRGYVHMRAGNLHEAGVALAWACDENPRHQLAHYRLAIVRESMGDEYGAAIAYQGCRVAPGFAPGILNLAVHFDDLGKHHESVSLYREHLAICPSSRRGQVLLRDAISSCLEKTDERLELEAQHLADLLSAPLENSTDLSCRYRSSLRRVGVHRLIDALVTPELRLAASGISPGCLAELRHEMWKHGLKIGQFMKGIPQHKTEGVSC